MSHPRYAGPVIDAHCHWDASTYHMCLADMDEAGVDVAVQLWDIVWPPNDFTDNAGEWDALAPRLARCLVPDLTRVDAPDGATYLKTAVEEAAARGAVGIKVWKNLGLRLRDASGSRRRVNDRRLQPLWEAAAEVDLPIAIHVGDHKHFWDPLDANNPRHQELVKLPEYYYGDGGFPTLQQIHEELEDVVSRNPQTTFIGVHFGCFMEWPDLRRVLRTYPNFNVDTATALCDIGKPEFKDIVRGLFLEFSDRILFGSDSINTERERGRLPDDIPLSEYLDRHWRIFETADNEIPQPLSVQGDWRLSGLDLPLQVLEQLYWRNALRLFKFSEPTGTLVAEAAKSVPDQQRTRE